MNSVVVNHFAYEPKSIEINAGECVVWTFLEAHHSATADDGSWDSGIVSIDTAFSHTFDKPGTYPYYCVNHGGPGGEGMSGVVVVKPS